MGAKPLGRPPGEPLGRAPSSASGGGSGCIPPEVQDGTTTLPWCFGFVAGTGTIDGNAAVGRAFGTAIVGAPFGAPIGRAPPGIPIFEFADIGSSKYFRFQPQFAYDPAVTDITVDLLDECSNLVGTLGASINAGVYESIGGKNIGLVDGVTYYVRATEA